MILDLHNHSIKSDDGRAKVENYCQWIRKRELALDGIVLTEHRQFDDESDYRALEDEYGILILKASEVETDYGHVLVFGVNDAMRAHSEGAMKGILQMAPAPIVSRDVIGNTHSCVFSPDDTFVKDGTLVKVLGWYDNEWGFSQRTVEMMARML